MALYSNGKQLGYKSDGGRYVLVACPRCSKERWIRLRDHKDWQSKPLLCRTCNGHDLNYKGGRRKLQGYIDILLRPDDFFYLMARKGNATKMGAYAFEHRLVMARHLGRNLHPWELVHHRNHIRDDNRIENLQLISNDKHNQLTLMETRISKLENKVEEQSKLIRLLQWQLKESQGEVHHRSLL